MKKLSFLGAALLAASLIFTGCSNGNDSDSGSGGGGNPQSPALPGMDVSDFADCTVTADSLPITDGSTWLLQFMEKGNISSRAANGMDYTMEFCIISSPDANKGYDFTDGGCLMTLRTSDVMGPYYAAYIKLPAEQKTQFSADFEEEMKSDWKNDRMGNLTDASIDDNFAKVTYSLSSQFLSTMRSQFDINELPSNKIIKKDSAGTKYILTVPDPYGTEEDEVYYFRKQPSHALI